MGSRTTRAQRRRRGTTLVELALASTVLLIALLATTHAAITVDAWLQTSRETNAACADLAQAMEELLLLPLDDIPAAGSPFEADQPLAAFDGLNLRDERIVASYPGYVPGAAVPDPLEVVLTASWTYRGGGTRSLRLTTLRTR